MVMRPWMVPPCPSIMPFVSAPNGTTVNSLDGLGVVAVGVQRAHHQGRQHVVQQVRVDGVAAQEHAVELVQGP
eukprot:4348528-Prymnesium_polylepis.1